MRHLAFVLLCLAAPAAMAEVPARVFPSIADTGATREQPQALSHWQKMAEDMAAQAAPSLRGVAVSAHAHGVDSAFDLAFHDFFVTALHRHGVAVVRGGHGARVEIDTFPLHFDAPRRTAHLHDEVCHTHVHHHGCRSHEHEHCRLDHSRYHRATRDELAVSVRVFDHGELAFSGSTTYYLPKQDLGKYRAIVRDYTPVLRVRGD